MEHTNQQRIAQLMLPVFAAVLMVFAINPEVAADQNKKNEKQKFDKVIELGVKAGQMKYDKKEFSVPAGGRIKLIFDNTNGTLQHNVLILEQGNKQSAISLAQEAWSMQNPIQNDYVPDSEKVLHASTLLSPGEKESITFDAPEKTGDHPYVCTMPGHAMSMNGMMHVKPSKSDQSNNDGDNESGNDQGNNKASNNKDQQKKNNNNKKDKFDKVIKLGVKPGQMKYNKKEISVPAGGRIKLVFDNTNGTLQHNVLILKKGNKQSAISLAQEAWSMQDPIQNDYVPDSEKVLYASSLLSPGKKEAIIFDAPEKVGDHPYVCTMPGHAMSMNGTMHVKGSSKANKNNKKHQNNKKKKRTKNKGQNKGEKNKKKNANKDGGAKETAAGNK